MAKAAVNHFVATLAGELAAHRINVNAINPGWIDTPGEHETFGSEVVATEGPQLPWGRIGTPDDIAAAVAFLASDEADYITGAALRVDGGFVLR
jgi:glucose 1-dehydrogenase